MTTLFITPYSALEDTVRRHGVSHVLTLIDPNTPVPTPASVAKDRHLRIGINDIAEPIVGHVEPNSDHIAEILTFVNGWDRKAPFLVHCWAGISRSTAAAFIMLCDIHGPGHEESIAQGLRRHAPHAHPNRLMIRHADTMMGRNGHMISAVEAMGPPRLVWEGEVVELPLSLEDL